MSFQPQVRNHAWIGTNFAKWKLYVFNCKLEITSKLVQIWLKSQKRMWNYPKLANCGGTKFLRFCFFNTALTQILVLCPSQYTQQQKWLLKSWAGIASAGRPHSGLCLDFLTEAVPPFFHLDLHGANNRGNYGNMAVLLSLTIGASLMDACKTFAGIQAPQHT